MSAGDLSLHRFFVDVPPQAMAALKAAAKTILVPGGERLIAQGDTADALYFVESGRFRVIVGGKRVVAHIETGEVIGELAFFAGGVRTADVTATRDSQILEISRDQFDRIGTEFPALTTAMLKLVSERLARATARTSAIGRSQPRVIAILPSGHSAMPVGFAAQLAEALRVTLNDSVPVTNIDRHSVHLPDRESYRAWLAERETEGGYILIDASGSERWSNRVCRNADAVVMVVDPDDDRVEPSVAESNALEWIEPEQRTLVFCHRKPLAQFEGARRWIGPRDARLHHHISANDGQDFLRLARFLTGKAVGLVLAGGGALGCAHLGVVKALQRSGIPIDFIGGASAGAAMGAAIAQGLTVDETLDQMEEMFIKAKAMRRLTLPIYSLLDPTVFDAELRKRYTNRDIADQPVNFFGVSTNLSNNRLEVHRTGPLWETVRASGSLPTILPPFIDGHGNILVDGGVLDNVPVSVMHQMKTGPNIVVSLGDPNEIWQTKVKYDSIRSRWRLLRDIILRRKNEAEFPSIVEIMSRSMVVASRMASRQMLGPDDALITPPIIPEMQILHWHLGRELAEMAAEFVEERLATDSAFRDRFTK